MIRIEMVAYFEGKKDLFQGLKIEELERDNPDAWQEYPVFYIDFNKNNFRADSALEQVLDAHLKEWEKIYGEEQSDSALPIRFQYLIKRAAETTGKNVVVLVDEYDKPLLEGADADMIEHNKAVFKGFFSTLKSYDRYIKFVFITGVTKFSKVSIFSDLNQLNDISLDREYGGICGITQMELEQDFQNVIYIVFMLLGQYTMTEIHSAKGRADCIVETDDLIYIFEFKRDESAKEAFSQIEKMGYDTPYAADERRLLKIGVNFNSKDRTIDDWKVLHNRNT